jgi:hypothetical protein
MPTRLGLVLQPIHAVGPMTGRTMVEVAAQVGRATGLDRTRHLPLMRGQSMGLGVSGRPAAQDARQRRASLVNDSYLSQLVSCNGRRPRVGGHGLVSAVQVLPVGALKQPAGQGAPGLMRMGCMAEPSLRRGRPGVQRRVLWDTLSRRGVGTPDSSVPIPRDVCLLAAPPGLVTLGAGEPTAYAVGYGSRRPSGARHHRGPTHPWLAPWARVLSPLRGSVCGPSGARCFGANTSVWAGSGL